MASYIKANDPNLRRQPVAPPVDANPPNQQNVMPQQGFNPSIGNLPQGMGAGVSIGPRQAQQQIWNGQPVAPTSPQGYGYYSGALQTAMNAPNVQQALQGLQSSGLNAGQDAKGGWYVDVPTSNGTQRMTGQAALDYMRKTQYEQQMQGILGGMPTNITGQLPNMQYNPSQQWGGFNQSMNQMGGMIGNQIDPNYFYNPNQGGGFPNPGGGQPGGFSPMMPNPQQQPGQMGTYQMPQNAGFQTPGNSVMPSNIGQAAGNVSEGGAAQPASPFFDQYINRNTPQSGFQITQPNVGNLGQSPDYQGAVSGDNLSTIGQQAANQELQAAQQMMNDQGILDPATREAYMKPFLDQAAQIQQSERNRLMSAGENLGFNQDFQKMASQDIAQSTMKPIAQAESQLIGQEMQNKLARQQTALGTLGNIAGRETNVGLQQKGLNLEAASQAGNFKLGEGTFNLNKGQLNLDAQQIEQQGKLTELGMKLQDEAGRAGLSLDKYKTDKGYDLDKLNSDRDYELKKQGADLNQRIQAASEFYQGLGMSMDAQDRQFQRQTIMSQLQMDAAKGDDQARFQYAGLQAESFLQAQGLDTQTAMFAGELISKMLMGREELDQQEKQFLQQLDAQSGGSFLGQLAGTVGGGILGAATGGFGTAIGSTIGKSLLGG